MKKRILFINGSLRKKSFNQVALDYLMENLESRGFEVKQLDYSKVPFMNQDIEFPAPEEIINLRKEVEESQGLWIVSPEYNGSIPAGLKNTLDWLSRPLEKGSFGAPEFFKGKLVGISGVAGRSGASLVIEALMTLLKRIGTKPIETTVGISLPAEAWKTGKFLLSDENKSLLDKQIEEYLLEFK